MKDGPIRILSITGGSGTGKSTLARAIAEEAGQAAFVSLDDYFTDRDRSVPAADYDFDRPELIEWDRLYYHLSALKQGCFVHGPIYNHASSSRTGTRKIDPAPLIIAEGLFLLHHPDIRAISDFNIFLPLDEETRLARRLARDCAERGCTAEAVHDRWTRFVKPAHEVHVETQKPYCHLLLDEEEPAVMARKALAAFRQMPDNGMDR